MLLYYDCISEFNKRFYEEVIHASHLQGGEIRIDKLNLPDGGIQEEVNFWGYTFQKNEKKYLLPSMYKGIKIDLKQILPLIPKDLEKVAYRGQVYWMINKPISVKFKPQKTITFKKLVDILSYHNHTNKEHQKILWFLGLASIMERVNFRLSTPPSFGKDSVVDIVGNLFGGSATIEQPTIAKLEYMTSATKWLAINEVIDLKGQEWRNIEQFLLQAGAHKPSITKHSRAVMSGVTEILDISHFSISILYNDIDCYPDMYKYLDFISKDAVLDRFPAFRLYGVLNEDFNQIKNVNVSDFVSFNMENYKELIYNFTYYKENLFKELKHFKVELPSMPERWKINVGRILRIIDLYSDNQEEFSYWCKILFNSMQDYKDMLKYPLLIENYLKKNVSSNSEKVKKDLIDRNLFKDKNKEIDIKNKEKDTSIKDTMIWWNKLKQNKITFNPKKQEYK